MRAYGIRRILGILLVAGFLVPIALYAQAERSYEYQGFSAKYAVQQDASVQVEEDLTYAFHGAYHQGYRSLPHAGSDAITDIRLIDGSTGQPLTYSRKKLDKTDPASWGTYTVYTENGATDVEWYYDLADTTHTWKLEYTLHGAIAFRNDHDELYWNLFTGLDAPVVHAQATVVLPRATSNAPATWYVNGDHSTQIERPDSKTFVFSAQNFMTGEPATIAAGWDKGIVSKRAYWLGWLAEHWTYLLTALILLATVLFSLIYWFITERYPRIGEVIVPEYAPPRGLPPIEGELVMRESLSSRAWPATIVDLAVRGHLAITELPHYWYNFGTRYYELRRTESSDMLRPYESAFLDTLFDPEFAPNNVFSTKELAWSPTDKSHLYKKMKELEKNVLAETDVDTKAFSHSLAGQQRGKQFLIVILVMIGFLLVFIGPYLEGQALFAYLLLIASVAASFGTVRYMMRYEARLSPDGEQLRKDMLGFKLYLKTAERYRLQNLTPDMFEKYLPYAMIFRIEKQWAKAFDGMNVAPPGWYAGSYVAGTSSSPSFSASSFASSFSASFASSFSSTGGSGAAGGGGSAGGGGGGGGGGAS